MATTINLRFQPTSVLFDTAHPILHFGIHGSQALFMLQSFHSFPQDKQQTIRVVESVVFRVDIEKQRYLICYIDTVCDIA